MRRAVSGMWRRVDIVLTEEAKNWCEQLADYLLLSSTLKMEEIGSSETSVNTISTRRNIPEDCSLHHLT
jgi:hypothetical protein